MSRIRRTILSRALAGTLATLIAGAAAAAEFEPKLAYVAQTTNPFHTAMEFFRDKVREKTDGRMEVQLFHSQQLGGERDYAEGLQLGTIEMAGISTAPLTAFEPKIGLFSLPFLFRSPQHMDAVLDGPIGDEIAAEFPPKGMRVLGYLDLGGRYIHNSQRIVKTPEDMQGIKFRVMEDPIHIETYRALGARAVPMARPEVYAALKQGVLDGLDNALAFYESMGDYEVAKYLTIGMQIRQTPGVLLISEAYYQSLPEDIQAAVVAAAEETVPYQREVFRAAEQEILERLKTKGVEVGEADPAPFENAAHAVWEQFAVEVGGMELIERVAAAE